LLKKIDDGSKTIDYIYAADGTKLAKQVYYSTITYYAGSFNYKRQDINSPIGLDYIQHPEGLLQFTGTTAPS
jgi:hypothetical protein